MTELATIMFVEQPLSLPASAQKYNILLHNWESPAKPGAALQTPPLLID